MKNVLFIGPPGCGKGTQSANISLQHGYLKLSTGDLLRKISNDDSELGKRVSATLSKGDLLSDEMVNQIVSDFYSKCNKDAKIILDGYPRNLFQAEELDKILSDHGENIDLVFHFMVNDNLLIKRITGRYTCKSCGAIYNSYFCPTTKDQICDHCGSSEFQKRNDDNEEVVKNRLDVYKNITSPLIKFYKNKIREINAEKSADEVYKQIVSYL